MKTICYIPLHYGSEYLHWTLKSIRPFVDDIIIFYYSKPCSKTDKSCPDTRDQLFEIAKPHDVIWLDRQNCNLSWGQRCDEALRLLKREYKADIAMVSDSDEIWEAEHIQHCLDIVKSTQASQFLVTMRHFWRSFGYICDDEARPRRFDRLDIPKVYTPHYFPREIGDVYHFGYAISDELMRYKWQCSDHRAELRSDWFKDKWSVVSLEDVHPTNNDYWYPTEFDRSTIEHLIGDHPYYNMELIS